MPDHNGFPDDVAIANVIVSEAPWTGHRLAVSLAAKKWPKETPYPCISIPCANTNLFISSSLAISIG